MGLKGTQVFERGDKVFMVAPVSPLTVTADMIEEFAFADSVKRMRDQAPNPNLAWFGGHYVEADAPNRNGAMWTSGELAIKAVTPMFMPVTVMHDPRTAVGLIADTSLKTPEADNVPRAKIETALALWAHRFPEAVEEAMHNYQAGTLMQSMECMAPSYSCSTCGMTYQKLPKGAERANWCDHLLESNPTGGYTATAGETPTAVRILRQVCFTGTGLIYGTRGARGADPSANLEAFYEEVAEYHERSHSDQRYTPRRTRTRMDTIEIAKTEYAELSKRPTRDEFDAEKARADEAEQKLKDAETAAETAEAAKAKAETEKAEAEKALKDAEETAAAADLKSKRLDALGSDFKAKLGEKTKAKLNEQAGTMSDEDWTARLDELAEAYGVAADAGGKGAAETAKDDETVFSKDEVARSRAAGGSEEEHASAAPSGAAQSSVIGGLFSMARGGKL